MMRYELYLVTFHIKENVQVSCIESVVCETDDTALIVDTNYKGRNPI